ncbi:hypothetical protein HAV15_005657 [Penicillium sp. str. |nr:hypothetical protein HAV15_005657 [Penicillium sp. str. \
MVHGHHRHSRIGNLISARRRREAEHDEQNVDSDLLEGGPFQTPMLPATDILPDEDCDSKISLCLEHGMNESDSLLEKRDETTSADPTSIETVLQIVDASSQTPPSVDCYRLSDDDIGFCPALEAPPTLPPASAGSKRFPAESFLPSLLTVETDMAADWTAILPPHRVSPATSPATGPIGSPSFYAPPPTSQFGSPLDSNFTREVEEPTPPTRPNLVHLPISNSVNVATPITVTPAHPVAQPQSAVPFAPPRPDALGRSLHSFDGSRSSRFTEVIDQ